MSEEGTQETEPAKDAAERTRFPVRWEIALVVTICSAGLFLRLWNLTSKSLWIDEILTVMRTAGESWTALAKRSDFLMYGIQRVFFLALPQTDFFFRLPSVISGVAALLAIYVLGREVLGRKQAFIAALLLCLAPLHIHHSQEARHYAHQALFTVLGTWFLIRALKQGRRRDWFGFASIGLLNVLNHQVGLIIVGLEVLTGFVIGAFVLKPTNEQAPTRGVRVLRSVILPLSISMLAIGLVFIVRNPAHLRRVLEIAGVIAVEKPVGALKATAIELDRLQWLHLIYRLFAGTVFLWIPLFFLVLGLAHAIWRARVGAIVIAVLGIVPILVVSILPLRWHPYDRYFVWVLPFFSLGVANGLVTVGGFAKYLPLRPRIRVVAEPVLLCLIVVVVYGVGAWRLLADEYRREKGSEWKMAAGLLKEQHAPGEIILAEGKPILRQQIRFGLRHYFRYGKTRMDDPPEVIEFPGIDKIDELGAKTPTVWRVHRTRRIWGVTPAANKGEGTFPGVRLRRFVPKAPGALAIPNGSFEFDNGVALGLPASSPRSRRYDNIANNGIPDGWYPARQGKVAIELDPQVRSHGQRSLRVQFRKAGSYFHLISMPIPADAGYIFEASARVRVAGKAVAAVFAIPLDSNLKSLKNHYLRKTGEQDGWQVYRLTDPSGYSEFFVTPRDTVAVCMMVQVERRTQPGTTVWFDDLRISGAWPLAATARRLRAIVGDSATSSVGAK